jgi:hypothetical protein
MAFSEVKHAGAQHQDSDLSAKMCKVYIAVIYIYRQGSQLDKEGAA